MKIKITDKKAGICSFGSCKKPKMAFYNYCLEHINNED